MEIPTKVNNVFRSRDVNVSKNNLVTKSPVTFPNKLERSQKSKTSTFFPLNSKAKSDSTDKCPPSSQIRSTDTAEVATAKLDIHFANGIRASSSSLDAHLGFQEDNWDDFDDFECPVKGKNVSFSSEKCEWSTNPVPSPGEEKLLCTGKGIYNVSVTAPEKKPSEKEQSCAELNVLERSVQVAAVSQGPDQDQEDYSFGDSPVRPRRRRHTVHTKSVLSDSEDHASGEPFEESKGNKSFMTLFIISHILAIQLAHLYFACYVFLETKSSWIASKVIEIDDNSEPENDLDFIPPSPVSDEICSALATRLVHLINNLYHFLTY